ncbi:GntR family transcriptional regulator [Streptomyces sp. NPDC093105]|uniref:GntR family transcriptional regulator n=1 Tax=Streptomyces sp. NPDC093105 TaxID=3366029 RepID=UPI00381DCB4A
MDMDRSDPTPLYKQVARVMRERIESGEPRPRDPIPSGIARNTARLAVALLRAEGWVITLPQRGGFVAGEPPADAPETDRTHG